MLFQPGISNLSLLCKVSSSRTRLLAQGRLEEINQARLRHIQLPSMQYTVVPPITRLKCQGGNLVVGLPRLARYQQMHFDMEKHAST
jgi:hypothetical protein